MACIVAGAWAATSAFAAADLRIRDRLEWTRADGTPVAFDPHFRVWCGPWASDVAVRSIHVRVGTRSAARPAAWWELSAVVADVKRRPVVALPHSFVFDQPSGAQLFAVDGENELNSDDEASRGKIRFDRVRCGRRLRIAFRFNGRLGSEFFDGEPVAVRGSFRASAS
jgi:hypothetical protein